MNEIICPHCHKAFKIDEAGYADILKQVHGKEFDKEIHTRLEAAEREKTHALELAKTQALMETRRLETELKSVLDSKKSHEELAVSNAVSALKEKMQREIADKNSEIQNLNNDLANRKNAEALARAEAVNKIEKQRDDLAAENKRLVLEHENAKHSLKEKYDIQIRDRDAEIHRMQDMKARLSTKMVGETLEQHCETEFNALRATAFPRAYFEKDNDARSGSKGDYIFRDLQKSADGTEIETISIMFEMKNESDSTATKKRNEDFLKELDKDRNEKKCEYAVLVSLLEPENDLYNRGIVDVSYRFPKMYVIRPQFFVPIISLLTNAARNSLEYKTKLALVSNQNIDVSNFEDRLNKFKEGFDRNYRIASEAFQKAIGEIDKSIDHLQKTKAELLKTENNLRLANKKAEDVTIKKLTHDNATMRDKFARLENGVGKDGE